MVINRPLSASSVYYDPQHPPCSIHAPVNLFPQSLSKYISSTTNCNNIAQSNLGTGHTAGGADCISGRPIGMLDNNVRENDDIAPKLHLPGRGDVDTICTTL